ncbi:hypothetical protein ACFY7C_33320 [Streptomyces sp. NPDC012769]|uniref:hypothetical protein n=1 Tax=Streptomyces sp. NPDC012769 TaxID=3364848 RepID=UPI0036A02933
MTARSAPPAPASGPAHHVAADPVEAETEAEGPDGGVPGSPADEPAPLGVVRTPTGRPAVDALLDRLGDADHLTADGHLDVYEDVHQGLRAELTALDERPGPRPYDNRS